MFVSHELFCQSKVDLLQGADPNELESKIKKYYEVEGAGGEPALIPGQVGRPL